MDVINLNVDFSMFSLLVAIRYLEANVLDYEYCFNFNRQILIATAATKQEVEAIKSDPGKAPLDAHEKAMLKLLKSQRLYTRMMWKFYTTYDAKIQRYLTL